MPLSVDSSSKRMMHAKFILPIRILQKIPYTVEHFGKLKVDSASFSSGMYWCSFISIVKIYIQSLESLKLYPYSSNKYWGYVHSYELNSRRIIHIKHMYILFILNWINVFIIQMLITKLIFTYINCCLCALYALLQSFNIYLVELKINIYIFWRFFVYIIFPLLNVLFHFICFISHISK